MAELASLWLSKQVWVLFGQKPRRQVFHVVAYILSALWQSAGDFVAASHSAEHKLQLD